DRPLSHVADYADDLAEGILGLHQRLDLLAERLFTAQELPHECLVDNKALWRLFHVVGLGEISSVLDGNTQCPKISRHYASNDGEEFLAGFGGRAAFEVHPGSKARTAGGLEDHRTGRADSRQMLDLLDRAAEESSALRAFLIAGRR